MSERHIDADLRERSVLRHEHRDKSQSRGRSTTRQHRKRRSRSRSRPRGKRPSRPRSRSLKDRSRTPRKRSRTPTKRSRTPRQRSRSPRRRARSSRKRSRSTTSNERAGRRRGAKRSRRHKSRSTCFVTSGVSMNLMSHGLVVGFTAVLLPELRKSRAILLTDAEGSWIASIISIALVVGALSLPFIMIHFGRRAANAISVSFMLTGWFTILFATSVATLIIARFLQGLSMGLSTSLCSVLIGEYTSPKNRGAFLTTISLAIACGTLISHTLGSYFSWQTISLVCAVITFFNLMIVIYSPESPSYLVSKGRYDECRKQFHWLRGYDEEDELEKMIRTHVSSEKTEQQTESKLQYYKRIFRKKEFYKPLILVMHLYMIGQWSGANILAAYTQDIFRTIIGDVDVSLMIFSMDVQRIISNSFAIFVIRRVRRRPMLISTISINFLSFLGIGIYSYLKSNGLLTYDYPFIGIMLIHIHMFSIATGSVPLPNIIAGEVFALEYKGLAGTISVLFLSLNLFITLKSNSFFFSCLGLHGTYWLYASIVGYSLFISWWMLPETKDRVLQDIEEEFRGRSRRESADESAESIWYEGGNNTKIEK